MAEIEYADQRTEHPETKHEGSDVSLRWIVGSAIALVVSAIVIFIVLWWIFLDYLRKPAIRGPVSILAEGERPGFPPSPQIEGLQPAYDIPKDEAAEEFRQWNRYGWVNRDEGIIRMPIEEAMKIAVKQLPSRPSKGPDRPGSPWDLPDDANSGRTLGAERP